MAHRINIDNVEHVKIYNVCEDQMPDKESDIPSFSSMIRILTATGETLITLCSYREPFKIEFDISG
ncbi:hypothetical protein [Allochromatium palmeri]|uniref:Uncharacterized protein n=1 Tax=Allochromatium palmeri TaxID=231048 RepID=A0A6N8EG41_9GAMM|nr:hypothetical protein [Allochromatium palmeri]MTW22631.1 hypothetical protein [Allochromatium palmeri]